MQYFTLKACAAENNEPMRPIQSDTISTISPVLINRANFQCIIRKMSLFMHDSPTRHIFPSLTKNPAQPGKNQLIDIHAHTQSVSDFTTPRCPLPSTQISAPSYFPPSPQLFMHQFTYPSESRLVSLSLSSSFPSRPRHQQTSWLYRESRPRTRELAGNSAATTTAHPPETSAVALVVFSLPCVYLSLSLDDDDDGSSAYIYTYFASHSPRYSSSFHPVFRTHIHIHIYIRMWKYKCFLRHIRRNTQTDARLYLHAWVRRTDRGADGDKYALNFMQMRACSIRVHPLIEEVVNVSENARAYNFERECREDIGKRSHARAPLDHLQSRLRVPLRASVTMIGARGRETFNAFVMSREARTGIAVHM